MRILTDYTGLLIRLTDERLIHILEHPEMASMEDRIGETLARPETVIESLSDPAARLYYRFYVGTKGGDKHLCIIVKLSGDDAFVVTAYLTDSVKKGRVIWASEK